MKIPGGLPGRFLLLLFCLAAAAVNTGNNLLYLVLSIMIALAAVASAVSARALRRLELRLLLPDEVEASARFLLGVEATAKEGRYPSAWADAEFDDLPVESGAFVIPSLPPGGRTVVSAEIRAPRRGVYEKFRLTLRTDFPFGLFRRRRDIEEPARLVVTPRRRRLRSLRVEAPSSEGERRESRPGEGIDLFNIREYTTQDDARRIDWKASARLDRPMLKEFERDQERTLEVVLDERHAGWSSAAVDGFEERVELAASILDWCAERGVRAHLAVTRGDGAWLPLSGRAAMAYLATVEMSPGSPVPQAGAASAGNAARIVLSHDPAVRTRLHIETAEPRDLPAGREESPGSRSAA